MQERIEQFDNEPGELIVRNGWTPESSRIEAMKAINTMIEQFKNK